MQSTLIYITLVLAVLFEMAVSEAMKEDQALKECYKEIGIGEKDVLKFSNATKEEKEILEPKLKKLSTCLYKKNEAVDDSGNFDVDRLVQIFKDDLEDAKKVINKCIKDAESIKDLEEKIYSVAMCIYKIATSKL